MKFGRTFECHLTPEWRQQYMNYAELKAMILEAARHVPDKSMGANVLFLYLKEFDETFFRNCEQELSRVANFFAQKLAEARRKLSELEILFNPIKYQSRHLSLACSEFYLSLIMLHNFQSLNFAAFVKITKKYDKYMKSSNGTKWFNDNINNAPFAEETELRQMISKVENLYTIHLTKGNRAKAMEKLRVPPLRQTTPPTRVFLAGLWMGLFIISAAIVGISLCYFGSNEQLMYAVTNLFRGQVMWSICCFFIALNVCVWRNFGINYVLIFNVDLRHQLQPAFFLEVACILGYVYALSMIFYIHHKEFGIDNPVHIPLVSFLIPIALLLNPIRIINFGARIWVLRCLGRVLVAPFLPVYFADFWVAEQLTSIVLCLVDSYFLIRFYLCLYMNGDSSLNFKYDLIVLFVRCLPSWFRLAQSARRSWESRLKDMVYILNGIKYALMIVALVLSHVVLDMSDDDTKIFEKPWIWVYLFAAFCSATYLAIWDVFRDFALLRIWKCNSNIFLRRNLLYPKWFYYFGIVTNTLIRFIWVLEIFLIYKDYMLPYNCKTVVSLFEIMRRFIWNCLRLENEHLFNCGRFRAVRELHLKSLGKDGAEDSDKNYD